MTERGKNRLTFIRGLNKPCERPIGVADSAFIYNLAKSKRLNMTEFDAYLHSSDKYKEMDKVINQLVERGLMATPTIIINDRLVYVTNSYEELSRLLEYEL